MAYKNTFEAGMFDQEFTIEALSGMGNPLSALKEVLDFEQFRPILEPVFAKENRKSNAGRRGLDPVFMMKVMFLQRLYGFGDKQIEVTSKNCFQEISRLVLSRFLCRRMAQCGAL